MTSTMSAGIKQKAAAAAIAAAAAVSLYLPELSGGPSLNVLVHAANSVLALLLIYLLLQRRFLLAPLLGAVFFATHPLHAGTVGVQAGQGELAGTFFFLLAFISYVHYTNVRKPYGLALSGAFFLVTLFLDFRASVAFPAMVTVYALLSPSDRTPVEETPQGRPSGNYAAPFVLGTLALLAWFAVKTIGNGPQPSMLLSGTFPDMFFGLGYYVKSLLLPFKLTPVPQVSGNPSYLLLALIPATAIPVLYLEGMRVEAFLCTWVLVCLLPALPAVHSKADTLLGLDTSRAYLASAGFSMLFAYVLSRIKHPRAMLAVALPVVALLAFSTASGTAGLTSGYLPGKGVPLTNPLKESNKLVKLGAAALQKGDYGKAKNHLTEALKLNNRNYAAYFNLGELYIKLYDSIKDNIQQKNSAAAEGISLMEQGREILPSYDYIHYNLGLLYMTQHQWDKSRDSFNTHIALTPDAKSAQSAKGFLRMIEQARMSPGAK